MTTNVKIGCSVCGETEVEFIELNDEKCICANCGGTVLTVQEAFDKILELKSLIRSLADDNEFKFD